MITLDHPEMLDRVRQLPIGLFSLWLEGVPVLGLKASKQSLLSIRQKGELAIYVMPAGTTDGTVIGLVSAFFDDAESPLTVSTPLFGDEQDSIALVGILMSQAVDMYLFDEHSREWMSYRCALEDDGSHFASGEPVRLLEYTPESSARMLAALREWFVQRTPEDDHRAIRLRLVEELWPSDISVIAADKGADDYIGSTGVYLDALERDAVKPGFYQERDIVAAFRRFLEPEQVILNPFRRGSPEEFVDVVAATADVVILVQAKDSPNDARSMGWSLTRKLAKSVDQLASALTQTKGSAKFSKLADPVPLTVDGVEIDLHLAGRRILNLVIIREVFPSQTSEIRAAILSYGKRGESLVVVDYQGFCAFVHHFPDERALVRELEAFACRLAEGGDWISPHEFLLGRFLWSNGV